MSLFVYDSELPEHKIEVVSHDSLENGQPVTYKRAECVCGWQGYVTYSTREAAEEGTTHLTGLTFKGASLRVNVTYEKGEIK